jgi:hypothetical protein
MTVIVLAEFIHHLSLTSVTQSKFNVLTYLKCYARDNRWEIKHLLPYRPE